MVGCVSKRLTCPMSPHRIASLAERTNGLCSRKLQTGWIHCGNEHLAQWIPGATSL